MAQFRKDTHKYLGDGKTIFEVGMLSDRLTSSGTATDAFGRLRVSNPFTLFDSFHRYQINEKFVTSTSGVANTQYQVNESTINMNVGTASGAKCYRESKRVFAYQPGKSLLIMNTFTFNTQKTNLRQRVGYFNDQNGVFLENDGTGNYIVLRSYVTGSVVETRVAQTNWNMDKFDGTGVSSQSGHADRGVLDVTKSNIFWIDVEWLGVGDVRCGFVVDGLMVPAHIFHNDNINTTTYITTATLPIRYEIENTGTVASNSTLKQICSTVISEGGYELRGKSRTYGMDPNLSKSLTTAGTYYPLVSIRINPDMPDSVVVPSQIDVLPITTDNYRWKIVTGGTWSGDTWANVATDSTVQYQSNATATLSGYTELDSGYATSTVQGGGSITVSGADMFKYQLERDRFANTTTPLSLIITAQKNASNAAGSLTWMEIT